ncbi:uncharacterized protein METZ01_LOCUS165919, partial [marine metagenome]
MSENNSKLNLNFNPVHLAVLAALYPSYQAMAQDLALEEIV